MGAASCPSPPAGTGARAGGGGSTTRRLVVPANIMGESFAILRACGAGSHECQVVWVSPWSAPDTVTRAVHPQHRAGFGHVEVDETWLTSFFLELAQRGEGIRLQLHTHPARAFHSATDDAWPVVHSKGFLSLVIPQFARGPVGFDGAYLTEIASDGSWREVAPAERLEVR